MGRYINPPGETKEQWLDKNATPTSEEFFHSTPHSQLLMENKYHILLINNILFQAAMVIDRPSEYDYVLEMLKTDNRPKKFFIADIDRTLEVSG
jgi:hypothetical protein